jgi:hypothetical protein
MGDPGCVHCAPYEVVIIVERPAGTSPGPSAAP